jgi:methyl-accepting chemotaxis protein
MNLSTWKVRSRLTVGFGVVCAMLVLILGIGANSMRQIKDGMQFLVDDRLPKIETTSVALAQIDAIAIALRNMMLTQDPADRQKQVEAIQAAREESSKAFALLDKVIVLPKGKELLQQMHDHRNKYSAGQDALLALIAADKPDEARAYLSSQLRPVLVAYKNSVNAMIAFQREAMQASAKDAAETYSGSLSILVGLGLLSLALAAGIGLLITRSLLKELGGEPRVAADLARAVSQGDFTQTTAVKPGDADSLMASLAAMQGNLAKVVSAVRQGSEGVATASAEIAQGNQDLSARTESQASALEETAASMEELSSTVKQNADNARQANQLAQSASGVAAQGGEVVAKVVETMKDINTSSKKISDIISVIDGIAFQTNILALNAAVEAARAGEQGRGFAVVATEVRSLAGRSAEAAKEIKTLINASVERVEHGTALVDQAGSTMTEVVNSIRRVTDIMGEISAASTEQSAGVSQVGEAVTQMDQTTQQNAALVEEMAAAASSLKLQAQELVQVVSVFKLGQDRAGFAPRARPAVHALAPSRSPSPSTPKLASRMAPKPAQKTAALTPPAVSSGTKGGDAGDWESF